MYLILAEPVWENRSRKIGMAVIVVIISGQHFIDIRIAPGATLALVNTSASI